MDFGKIQSVAPVSISDGQVNENPSSLNLASTKNGCFATGIYNDCADRVLTEVEHKPMPVITENPGLLILPGCQISLAPIVVESRSRHCSVDV